jgi:membrane protease YdiL (CAAX protease family)
MNWQSIILLLLPPVLIATTYVVFQRSARRFGAGRGYLLGFLFYWIVWGLIVPLLLIGPQRLIDLFRDVPNRLGDPAWLGLICLVLPIMGGYAAFFPAAVRSATTKIVLVSIAQSLVNGVLEEVLWRGMYVSIFPNHWLLGVIYPAIGFGLWHLSPQSIFPHTGSGGKYAFAISAIFLGLAYGWVTATTGAILWVCVSHVLMDFAGLGGGRFFPTIERDQMVGDRT